MLTLAGCTADDETVYPDLPGDSIDVSGTELQADTEPEVMCSIRITAGDTVLYGVLYDNQTARSGFCRDASAYSGFVASCAGLRKGVRTAA